MVKERKRIMCENDKEFQDMLKEARLERIKKGIDIEPKSFRRLTKAVARMKTIPSIKEILINSNLEDDI